ncbi:hypothetical protein PG997_007177 [Apiospora hydei]|uniref:Uncharacterized protein n=1 Tax=Apiospora hydei TaxID=1337664 RepID=A0ABR1W798_9PEZI
MAPRSISSSSGDERPDRAVVECRRSSSSSSSSRAQGQQHERKRSREDEEAEEDERAPKRPLTEYAATLASLDTPGEFEVEIQMVPQDQDTTEPAMEMCSTPEGWSMAGSDAYAIIENGRVEIGGTAQGPATTSRVVDYDDLSEEERRMFELQQEQEQPASEQATDSADQASEDEEGVATNHSETRGKRVTCHKKQLPRVAAKGRGAPSATDVYIARIEARLTEQELEIEALQDEVDELRYENFERRYTVRELREYIHDAPEGSDIELGRLDRACKRRGAAASMAIGVFEIKRRKRRTLADDLKKKIRELQKKRQAERKWYWDAAHETVASTEELMPDDEGESSGKSRRKR